MNKQCLHETQTERVSLMRSVTLLACCILKTSAGMAFSQATADKKVLAVMSDTCGEEDTAVRPLLDVKDLSLQRQLMWQLRGEVSALLAAHLTSGCLVTSFIDGRQGATVNGTRALLACFQL